MYKPNFSTVERITKTTAKQAYEKGLEVLFIPCNLNPENNFYCLGIWENTFLNNQYETFDQLENAFSYYNNRPDTGKYTAFYLKREAACIHLEFADGSSPYVFRGSPRECLQELKKWGKRWNITPLEPHFYRLEEKHD